MQISPDPTHDTHACREAGLRWCSDSGPGIRRVKRGEGFAYRQADGRWLRDAATLARIRGLAIPPAYRDVWINPLANGHLQATDRDARGRKQYRYHPEWRAVRDGHKFERLADFGRALPSIRRRVGRDLAHASGGSEPHPTTVVAALVRLLDQTGMRIGNEAYARENGSYGLSTLRDRHASIRAGRLRLRFCGKSGVPHDVTLDDARLARIVQRCQALPGQVLFQCVDAAGAPRSVGSDEVNAYLRDAGHGDFTAKDFRTWHATVLAWSLVCESRAGRRRLRAADLLREVATRLGNTPAVCRKSYVHPGVLACCERAAEAGSLAGDAAPAGPRGLSAAERRLLAWLKQPGRG